MTIQTGRGKRGGARAGLGTGDRENGLTQRDSKDVPQFAPNFTVYVLPPDVVCLYSEDRKFFLHGALYCALASAIGAGKSFRQLVRELEKDFPSDKIHEALKRLSDRRFVVPAPRSSADHADAYWASLGLLPEDAKRNLQNCRVRIQSIDVQGATELGAALKALGVRVVKGAADLTVTLVSDYLEARLDELNRQHLSDRTRWLLVQPSGIFPLVGPVFSPGKDQSKSACWTCLAERMNATARSRPSSTANRPAASRRRRSPATCSGRVPSSLRPSRSRKRSPPTFARTCAITHQPRPAGLDHREALCGGPPAMSGLRSQGAARSRAARRRRSSLAPAASWS